MKIAFVVPCCNEIPVVVDSILNQTVKDVDVEIHLVHDGLPASPAHEELYKLYEKRFGVILHVIPGPNDDQGDEARDYGFKKISDDCDLIVFTGSDNYYVPKFIEFMVTAFEDPDCVAAYCDMIHDNREWEKMFTRLVVGLIDCGCLMTRVSAAREVGGWCGRGPVSDWHFIRRLMDKYGAQSFIKINRMLFCHN